MIKHLNHELYIFNGKLPKGYCIKYTCYKCQKCNDIIYSANYSYYKHIDGLEISEYNKYKWQRLTLTCEEEQIKNLLE